MSAPARMDGPWRRGPILGGVYSERSTGRRVFVVNVSTHPDKVQIIRTDDGSNRHTWIAAARLLDEGRWRFRGVTVLAPLLEGDT